jgi:hypothetical protein
MVRNVLLFYLITLSIHLNSWIILFLALVTVYMLNLTMHESDSLPRDIIIESYILRRLNLVNTRVSSTCAQLSYIACFLTRVQILLLSRYHLLLIQRSVEIGLSDTCRIRCHFICWSDLARLYRINCLTANFALVRWVWSCWIHSCALRLWSLLLIHVYTKIFILRLLSLVDILSTIIGPIVEHERITQTILFDAIARWKGPSMMNNLSMMLRKWMMLQLF